MSNTAYGVTPAISGIAKDLRELVSCRKSLCMGKSGDCRPHGLQGHSMTMDKVWYGGVWLELRGTKTMARREGVCRLRHGPLPPTCADIATRRFVPQGITL